MESNASLIIHSENPSASPWRFCVAPMLDWTDRHCRVFHRLLSRHARLYTEMVTTGAIIHGDRQRLLGFSVQEQPVAVQLGGSDPHDLAECARICENYGYSEINLNVGCPSNRVQSGSFGACLMMEPERVAAGVAAMKRAVRLLVSVKCRLGVDEQEPRAALFAMTRLCAEAGVDALIVHARKAWLQGLSPRENRDVPPLNYSLVYALKAAYPALPIVINGGVASLAESRAHLQRVDGVMMGRSAYHTPELLMRVDPDLFGAPPLFGDAHEALNVYCDYVETQCAEGVRLADMTRPLLGLFAGRMGARSWRRHLTIESVKPGAGVDVIRHAAQCVAAPAAFDAIC